MLGTTLRAAVVGGTFWIAAGAQAQEFGIESKVFAGRELVAAGTTLFAEDRVYDFLVRPDETIVMSLDDGRIDLLDNVRQIRTQLTFDAVTTFCEQLRSKAEQSESEIVRFCAAPQFDERLDPETGEVVLVSPSMEYRAKTLVPAGTEVLQRYEAYVERQTRVNALLNPGSPPPGPRLALNASLSKRQVLPQRVTLRRTAQGSPTTLVAEHHFTWRLGEPDRMRIAEAERRLATYRFVTVSEYLRTVAETAGR